MVAIEAGVGLLVGVVDLGDQVPPAAPLDPPSSCWRRASSCEAACGVRGGWPWPPGRRGSWANPWLANFDLDDLVGDLRVVDPGAVDRDAFDASCFGACWACLACVGSSAPSRKKVWSEQLKGLDRDSSHNMWVEMFGEGHFFHAIVQ